MKRWGPAIVEKTSTPSRARVLLVSIFSLVPPLLIMAFIFWVYGMNPWHTYAVIFRNIVATSWGWTEITRRAIPLLLCGVGLVIAFRAQFWNIGAEGQLLAGAVAAAGVALFSRIPAPWLIPAMFAAGFLAGALVAIGPALLKAILGVNDIISTLMLNYILAYIVDWLIHGPWRGASMRGFGYTDMLPEAAWLPLIPGTRIHWVTLVIGVVGVMAASLILNRTCFGYELQVVGRSREAARYAGINFLKITLGVAVLSGGLAGVAGVGEAAGIHFRLTPPQDISMGYGFTAIIVAWLARGSPVGILLSAFFFGLIYTVGDLLKAAMGMPFEIVDLFRGLVLFFVVGSEIMMYYRIHWGQIAKEEQRG